MGCWDPQRGDLLLTYVPLLGFTGRGICASIPQAPEGGRGQAGCQGTRAPPDALSRILREWVACSPAG